MTKIKNEAKQYWFLYCFIRKQLKSSKLRDEFITVEALVSGHPWNAEKVSICNWSWPLMGM